MIILDCLTLIYPNSSNSVYEKSEWNSVIKIESLRDLEQFFTQNKVKFAIDFIGATPIRNEIANILEENDSQFVVQKIGLVPVQIGFRMRLQEILNHLPIEMLKKNKKDKLHAMPNCVRNNERQLLQKIQNRILDFLYVFAKKILKIFVNQRDLGHLDLRTFVIMSV